jgi:penicillin-binding protein 2
VDEIRKMLIRAFVILIGIIFLARLLYIQVLDDSYKMAADNNAIRKIVQVPFRGQVYDRKNKLIVFNTPIYDLYVTPKKARVADTLRFCSLFDITRAEFDSLTKIARTYSRVRPSLFIRQLSQQDYARVQDVMVDYPGFHFQTSALRSYESKSMANALGYIGEISPKRLEDQEAKGEDYYRQGDYVGVTGLERYYEEELRGQRGIKYMMVNSNGMEKGAFKDGKLDEMPIAGKNLYTSIDVELQQFADSLMQHKVGSVVAIEPSTGEILTMVSAPTYDPNLLSGRNFSKYYKTLALNPLNPLVNRPPSAYYRPGSTFKLIQALVGLQMGVIGPGTGFGHAGAPVKCHGHPLAGTVHAGVQWSCNPYFYQVFKRIIYNNSEPNVFKKSAIGLQRWNEMVAKFGIGQELEVDLPNEKKGKLPSVEYYNKVYKGENRWKFSNVASLSIGEGELVVSPVKMANVAAIMANRGWYIRPHMVKGVGKLGEIDPKYKEHVSVGIDERHFDPVIWGMMDAVNRGTVAAEARIPDIQICGKTGTSQNRVGKDHSIFIAFAPKDNPKIAIAVFVENAGFGGFAAAPIASLVIEKFIKGKVERKAMSEKWMNKSFMMNIPALWNINKPTPAVTPPPMKPDTLKITQTQPKTPLPQPVPVPVKTSKDILTASPENKNSKRLR